MYKYTHLIKQNTAPKGATQIGVYQGDKRLFTVPLGRLTRPLGDKRYSFGLVSDVHIGATNIAAYGYSHTKFDNALAYFKSVGCEFCVICGDLTVTGLYTQAGEAYLDETQFAKYKEICDKHALPVYELMGNHESYYGMPISNNAALMEAYTGKAALSYTVEHENDVFILCGQPHQSAVMTDADFAWLGDTLEANKDKRCFVFVHPYIEDDSGDPCDVRENSIFDDRYWGAANRNAFMDLLRQYPNAVLFHGHSHMKFEYQALDVNANYTERNGFKSVHIPSLVTPRDIVRDEETEEYASQDDRNASQGYIVDVYDDGIVLNGWDFVADRPVPLAAYTIDT